MTPQLDEAEQLFGAAERDVVAFQILAAAAAAPPEIVLFHAQQAVEKFIKAVFAAQGLVYRRTHDLFCTIIHSPWIGSASGLERETVCGRDPAAEPTRRYSRRVAAPQPAPAKGGVAMMTLRLWHTADEQGVAIPAEFYLLARLVPYAVEFRYLGAAVPEVSILEAEALIAKLRSWAAAHVVKAQ